MSRLRKVKESLSVLGQNKKIPVFRVILPFFFKFSGKYNFIHFERGNAFQNA